MRKILFIFAAVLLSSIGLHAGNTITYKASAQLPGTTLSVGAYTFGPAITSHTFSNGTGTITCEGEITKIGISAFSNCHSLTSIEIPNSVTTIDINAFLNCTSLTSIEIPSSVKAMSFNVFYGCTDLISVIVNWTDAQSIIPLNSGVFEGIAKGAGPQGAMLYVPMGTADLYKQADGWKNFGSIAISIPRNTITYTATSKLEGFKGSLDEWATTFGPKITKHEFNIYLGTGTITCEGEITKIGGSAFRSCELTSITIPNSVTEIGYSAFEGCFKLTSITIPNSVTIIWNMAFFSAGLTSITIPNSVTKIGYSAFLGCHDLKDITISNSVTTIEEQTFNNCRSLTLVNIPNSVTTIKNMAFRACTSLTSIEIPNSVTQIEWGTFMECSNLQSVYCYALTPPSRVGGTIFANQPTVYTFNTGAYIESWSELPASCFKPISAEVGGIKYEFFIENNKYTARVVGKEGGYTGNVAIPEQVTYQGMTFTVVEIEDGAFTHSSITAVTIPTSVTKIGMGAFEYCEQLQSAILPSSLSLISKGAFQNTGLTSITIPASVERIDNWAFQLCPNLKEVIIPSSSNLTFIGERAFYNSGLTSITIPASVEKIENYAFSVCPLEYIISMSQTPPALGDESVFPNDKKAYLYVPTPEATLAYKDSKWGEYFSQVYSNITYNKTSSNTVEVINALPVDGKIIIPSTVFSEDGFYNVTGIADSAFYDQDTLVSILLPSSIQYIGNNAFNKCIRLKDVSIEFMEGLQTIGDSAFYGCNALDSIVIPEGVQSLGKAAFKGCRSLKYVSLPESLRAVPDECFRQSPLGQEIIVPEGIETIGKYAFDGTSETRLDERVITLPSTLKEVNLGAFYLRDRLKAVICHATTPPTLKDQVFASRADQYQQDSFTVYVPNRDVMAAYRDDKTQWGSNIYQFRFTDLMSEENKQYLYRVAGDNEEAQAIASAYCDSIDNYANNSEDVQQYTNTALGEIDKITLAAYKQRLIDSLANYAKSRGENIQAQQIAEQYAPQIRNTYFRQDAEQLYEEAHTKITAIFDLITQKNDCKTRLRAKAGNDSDLKNVAEAYIALIERAETKEEVDDLYTRAERRMDANNAIKEDWTGGSVNVDDKTCSITKGYIN